MAENTDVIVVGGGYAGVMAANRLTRRDGVTVTLINPRPAFVERIRLHQHLGGRSMAMLKETVCKSTVWQMAQEARRPGSLNLWFKDRQRQELRRAKAGEAPAVTSRRA